MSDEIIDLPEFLERVQEDKDLLLELLEIFSKDYALKRTQLNSVIRRKDYEGLKSLAHSLKGAAGNISAKPLRAVFLQLEEIARKNSVDGAEAMLISVDREYERFTERKKALARELKK